MPYKQLQEMLDTYSRTIGAPYGGWQMVDVLKLFDYCSRTSQTWQRDLCDATGVSSSKVNRFIDVAEKQGWIERPKTRTSDAKKPLHLTPSGRRVIDDFERAGRDVIGKSRHTSGRRSKSTSESFWP